jgi:hypothetical protein
MDTLSTLWMELATWVRLVAAALTLAAALLLARRAWLAGGRSWLPRGGSAGPWLRGFRLAAIATGLVAIGAGILAGQLWLVGVGLAFAFEETMETSVCLSTLSAGPLTAG